MKRMLVLAAVTLVLATSTGCSQRSDDQGDTMKLTGNCSITANKLSPTRVISESMVEKLLGPGEWTSTRGLSISDSGILEKAYVGQCGITPASNTDDERLRVIVVPKSEPQYDEAVRLLASGEGVTKVDDHTYTTPDPTSDSNGNRLDGAKGVLVNPDYALIVEILHPAEGVDAMKEAGPTVQAVADNLSHLG